MDEVLGAASVALATASGQKMRLLFLDFDGVLHPHDAGDVQDVGGMMEVVSVRADAPLFCRLPLLIDALRDHQDVQIVISSSWRRLYQRHELRTFLGVLVDRYLAEIPHLAGHPRHDEVVYFLRQRQLRTVPWLALDDDRANFPADCPNVLWTDPLIGLDDDSVVTLRKWLDGGEHPSPEVRTAIGKCCKNLTGLFPQNAARSE